MGEIKNRLISGSLRIFKATISYEVKCDDCENIYRRNKRTLHSGDSNIIIDKTKCPECGREYILTLYGNVNRPGEIARQIAEEHRGVLERSLKTPVIIRGGD